MSESSIQYVGAAPLTMIRLQSGGYGQVYGGDPVPDDITDGDLARLVDEGFLVGVEVVVVEEVQDVVFDPEKGGTIPETVEWVGADKARAQQVLDLEQAKGESARGSLVEKLQAVTAAE